MTPRPRITRAKAVLLHGAAIPPEWIAAHGLTPQRWIPRAPTDPLDAGFDGVCPYARALTESTDGAQAIVVAIACDQVRRATELLAAHDAPVFLLHAPATKTENSQNLYRAELRRLGDFLERLGGRPPSDRQLAEAMRDWESARTALSAARDSLPAIDHMEAIAALAPGQVFPKPKDSVRSGRPVAVLGAHLLRDDWPLLDLVETAGGRIALNGLDCGERTLPPPFDRRRLAREPFEVLADAYADLPDAYRRPNRALYDWLKRALSERGACGIVYVRYVWCDLWHAEVQRLKDWSPVPVLDLELADAGNRLAHASGRIQSFLEVLR